MSHRSGAAAERVVPQPTLDAGTTRTAAILDWLLASMMGLMLPLAPIAASVIARDGSYLRRYGATMAKAAGHLRGQVKSRAFSRYLLYDANATSTSDTVVGQCTHCGNCCLHRRCIYLDWSPAGDSRCRIYNSAFWKALACSRYPESRQDIALYACPSFSAGSEPPPDSPEPGAAEFLPMQAYLGDSRPHSEQ
ncbi:hypothetical protein EWI61_03100 [Methylolobus aquaticus]|nr:hypothetical protein EWI61_03100 [Methylolobus aquaticus]